MHNRNWKATPCSRASGKRKSRVNAYGRKGRTTRLHLERLEDRLAPAIVPLTVTVLGVGVVGPGSANFYSAITINGTRQETPRQFGSSLFVNWPITQMVDDTAPASVVIELLDDGAGPLDIDPKSADRAIQLTVDPRTGFWAGDLQKPGAFSQGGNDGRGGNLSFDLTTPGATFDSDGDGLPDSWEIYGVDLDVNPSNGVDLPLNLWGANPNHKDLFLEFDWMAGHAPSREAISTMKAAFAVAPIDAGTNASAVGNGIDAKSNPDGLPGINLWIDTGGLTDASGNLVGDNLGGGNQVPTSNISNLNKNFYDIKNGVGANPANFNPARKWAFRYAISGASPTNTGGTSTGGNAATTLNDTAQSWVTNEWLYGTRLVVSITGGTGAGQTRNVESNTATMLTVNTAWATIPDNTSTYSINWTSGGWGELGGNDFIEFNHDAGTIMHELGHTLNLGHGGGDGTNYKPNYISIMNYDHQFGIPQNAGGTIVDFAPARISLGGTATVGSTSTTLNDSRQTWAVNQWAGGYVDIVIANRNQTRRVVSNTTTQLVLAQPWSSTPGTGVPYTLFTAAPARASASLPALTENALNETIVLDPTDTANRLVFADPSGNKIQYPANGRNRNGTGPIDGPDYNRNNAVDAATVAVNVNAPNDATVDTVAYSGQDDWRRISLSFRQFGDSASGGINVDDHPSPNLQQLLQNLAVLNTTDLSLSVATSASTVFQGDTLVYTYTATVNSGNPADGVTIDDLVPSGVVVVSASTAQGFATIVGNSVKWTLGTIDPGVPVTLHLTVIPYLVGNMTNTATAQTIDTDPAPANNTAAATVLVRNVPPKITSLSLASATLNENDEAVLTIVFTDPGLLDHHTAEINWGDGPAQVVSIPFPDRQLTIRHRYLDDNPTATAFDLYAIQVTVRDNNAGSDTAGTSVRVDNVAPVLTSFATDAEECSDLGENDLVYVTGTFTDIGTLDTHSALIDWGDGSPLTPATIVESGGVGTLSASHAYAAGGIYRVVVTLRDDDTGTATDQSVAIISGVGILNGQLQIIGTSAADSVTLNRTGNGRFLVHTSFLADSPRSLPSEGVTSIVMLLCDGDDTATVAGDIDLPAVIEGGEGNDRLNGGRGPSFLLGGPGDDHLIGGSSHDILVGGPGSDRLVGNAGDDILIAGTLATPDDPIDRFDLLLDILAEWSLSRSKDLTGPRLIVSGDDAPDWLIGSAGADWFLYDFVLDQAADKKKEDAWNIG